MNLNEILKQGALQGSSDIHITVGKPPMFRLNGKMEAFGEDILTDVDTRRLVYESMTEQQQRAFEESGDLDYSYAIMGEGRYRANAYKQRGSCAMVLRIIPMEIPEIDKLGLPSVIKDLTETPRGLILVTGPTGSGKSTTLASMINEINHTRKEHILTLEDPIEFLHSHHKSVVNQREVGADTDSFASGLRAALREDPDVILVGEMRDLTTTEIALTAAETGHLVLSTLHTNSAAKTIDRVIGAFPHEQQQQIRIQFATVIQAIICQQLLPRADGKGRIGAYEIMVATPAIRNLIREEKIHQINSAIQTGANMKMITMDDHLIKLYKNGMITKDTALTKAMDIENIRKYIN